MISARACSGERVLCRDAATGKFLDQDSDQCRSAAGEIRGNLKILLIGYNNVTECTKELFDLLCSAMGDRGVMTEQGYSRTHFACKARNNPCDPARKKPGNLLYRKAGCD